MSENPKPNDRKATDPTLEDIQARSAEIRKGWSQQVSHRRQTWNDPAWQPPLILTIEVVRQINKRQE